MPQDAGGELGDPEPVADAVRLAGNRGRMLSIRSFCVFASSRPPPTSALTYTARSSGVEMAPPAVQAHEGFASV